MKALVYHGPKQMRVEEYPVPVPKEGETRIRPVAVGICGSDVHGYLGLTGRRIPPMVMGHEVVGRIEEDCGSFKAGDLVFVDPIKTCGVCANCRRGYTSICSAKENIGVLEADGAFCDYACVRWNNLIPLPDGVPTEVGVLAEPFAVAKHAVDQLRTPSDQIKTAAVIGSGIIGICTAAVLREYYPEASIVVLDVKEARLARCRGILGSVTAVNSAGKDSAALRDEFAPGGFDAVLEAVGIEPTVNQALDLVRDKGEVVLIGNSQSTISLRYQQIVLRELQVSGSYGFTHADLEHSVAAFAKRGYASRLVDKVIPLEQATEYFDKLADPDTPYLKIVVNPEL